MDSTIIPATQMKNSGITAPGNSHTTAIAAGTASWFMLFMGGTITQLEQK